MEDLWAMFCGETSCSSHNHSGSPCPSFFESVIHPSSCTNHAMIICFDALLMLIFFNMVRKSSLKLIMNPARYGPFSPLQVISAVVNGCVGLVYLCFSIWILEEKLRKTRSPLPLHWWVLSLFQEFTLLGIGITVSLQGRHLTRTPLRLLSVLAFSFAVIGCTSSIFAAVVDKEASFKTALDLLSFVAASLLLLCTHKYYKNEESYEIMSGTDPCTDSIGYITPFSKGGVFSRMTFWWLNTLMKKGTEKTLEDDDIPELREADRAEICYLRFVEQLNKQKQDDPSSQPSILIAIIRCHWNEIFVSGFFALLKILFLSSGPLLLNAFIKVAERKQDFKYEGYVLAISLFFAKSLESLSQRQWYFRSRLIGIQVRSSLTAAIYRKQLRVSNAAKLMHSSGQIINYATVDAYRIGEFPFWFHQTWTTSLQICLTLLILFHAVGLATIAALVVIVITVLCNMPLAKVQQKFHSKLMAAKDEKLKASSEALVNMKVLKLYAWETHFKGVIENLRKVEHKWLSAVQLQKAFTSFTVWSSHVLVSAAIFGACYFLGVPLYASNVFTVVATSWLLQNPIRTIPDVIGAVIQAKVAFARVVKFLEAPEMQSVDVGHKCTMENMKHAISIKSANFSWEENRSKPSLRNINLEVKPGQKVAVSGEVGSGKSALLAAIRGEIPNLQGTIQVHGKIAYASQAAWIQSGTVQENILFGSTMDTERYQQTLERCSLLKDLESLPYGDHTEIGERGINLSGGQKQRIQLARALYQDADIYLLDDPFSAVDAHTATSLFNEYVMEALSKKTVLLVTHQVGFLPTFDCVLLMSDGEILSAASYHQLLASSHKFQYLVHAHKETAGSERVTEVTSSGRHQNTAKQIRTHTEGKYKASESDQLIKKEVREIGDTGLTPYIRYLNQNRGFLYFSLAVLCQIIFVAGQISQSSWMAANVGDPSVSTLRLIEVYLWIASISTLFLLARSICTAVLGLQSSKSLFSRLSNSLFRAPLSFYESTPLGRVLSRISSDLSIVDLDVPFNLFAAVGSTINVVVNLGVMAVVTWQILVSIPMVYFALRLQRYYFASAKELMRINGTTKSSIANHLAESIAGAMTIRAFKEEDRFYAKNFDLIDKNASPFFHNFAANEWLILRLEMLSATVLSTSALCMALLPSGTFGPGFIGMALSYGLTLNMNVVRAIQTQCTLSNNIISVERISQYMDIPSEAPELIEENRPLPSWPAKGKVEIQDLQIRYRPNMPLVLRGISCTIEGGHKIGIVGRTGSGKTTLIGALFRLVEPAGGKIVVDGLDISKVGLHDLRSRFGIIPQDPTLFNGTVRYNLDPLGQHSDQDIWEVLSKCQLREALKEKEEGLDSIGGNGSNWSMGQQQLFCLGRALLRRSRVLVLDEATASIDNTSDLIIQKTIRSAFADCTVITVAHRIPTVMDCTMVLAISDGKLVEYDEPTKLMNDEGSLFGQLVKEYLMHSHSTESH